MFHLLKVLRFVEIDSIESQVINDSLRVGMNHYVYSTKIRYVDSDSLKKTNMVRNRKMVG